MRFIKVESIPKKTVEKPKQTITRKVIYDFIDTNYKYAKFENDIYKKRKTTV